MLNHDVLKTIMSDTVVANFWLERDIDETGISGVGRVAEGVIYSRGHCQMIWLTETSSVCFYQNIKDIEKIHGHNGKTRIVIESV